MKSNASKTLDGMKNTNSLTLIDSTLTHNALVDLTAVLKQALLQSELALQSSLEANQTLIDPYPVIPLRILTEGIRSAYYQNTGYSADTFLSPYADESPTVYYRLCVHTKQLLSDIETHIEQSSPKSK
ncbi:hypothetical protein AB6E39_15800 [Vibrio splendidus]|uniref:hypothetical protein n=2 Tax=Vibrio TaxID=662 RepID=UPI001E5A1BC6|nr:hypothetical protein [Vibrio splendidus]MCC4789336.1 hypothetical protein [Vibrio splendidus]CAK1929237.1 conserved hypothetical protein [Vibrio crassostreae]